MKGGLANINKAALITVFILLAAGGGFGWYRTMYTPAKLAKSTAEQGLETANAQVAAKRSELEVLERKGTDRGAFAKILISRRAIPKQQAIAELGIELEGVERKTGVTLIDVEVSATPPVEGATGPQPIDVSLSGHGTYAGLILFMQELQEMVASHRGQVYVRGRLINIKSLEISDSEEDSQSMDPSKKLPKGHHMFALEFTTYAETLDSSASASSSAPAAAGADGAPAGSGVGSAASGGTAGGQAMTDPAAQPSTPSTQSVPAGTS